MSHTPPSEPSTRANREHPEPPSRRRLVWIIGILVLLPFLLGAVTYGLLEQPPTRAIAPVSVLPPHPTDRALEFLSKGETESAMAVLLAVPPQHRSYSRAQRMLGWDIYCGEFDEPRQGLPYVRRSLLAEPTSSNVWQDAGRTLVQALRQ